MTASDIVTVEVKVAAPKIEITNVRFSTIPSSLTHSMREELAKAR